MGRSRNRIRRLKMRSIALVLAALLLLSPGGEALGATFSVMLGGSGSDPDYSFAINGVNIHSIETEDLDESHTARFCVMPGDILTFGGSYSNDNLADITTIINGSVTTSGASVSWTNRSLSAPQFNDGTNAAGWQVFINYTTTSGGAISIDMVKLQTTPESEVTKIKYIGDSGVELSRDANPDNLQCIPIYYKDYQPQPDIMQNEYILHDPVNIPAGKTFEGWYVDQNFDQKITKIRETIQVEAGPAYVEAELTSIKGFNGNSDAAGYSFYVLDDSHTAQPSTITLYAKYTTSGSSSTGSYTPVYYPSYEEPVENKKYTVKFDANGGSGSMSEITATNGTSFALPSCTFTAPEGKRFKAWLVNGTEYQPKTGDEAANSTNSFTVSTDVTVSAVWVDEKVKITFDANGGTGEMKEVDFVFGKVFELPECAFEAPEYKLFKAWEINGKEYFPKKETDMSDIYNSLTITGDTVIKALWENKTVKVTFAANGGKGSMTGIDVLAGSLFELPECTFAAPDKREFKGWEVNDRLYQPKKDAEGANDTNSFIITDDTVITAVWNGTIKIRFNAAGGTGTMQTQEAETGDEFIVPECAFKKTDMLFAGWMIEDTVYNPGDKFMITGDVKLTAQWVYGLSAGPEHVKVKVSDRLFKYDANEHRPVIKKVTIDEKTLVEGVDYTLINTAYIKAGQYRSTVCGIGMYQGSETTVDWEITKLKISLVLSDKSGSSNEIVLKKGKTLNPSRDISVRAYEYKKNGTGAELTGFVQKLVKVDKNGHASYPFVTDKGTAFDPEAPFSLKTVSSASGQAIKIPVNALEDGLFEISPRYDVNSLELVSDSNPVYVRNEKQEIGLSIIDTLVTYGADGNDLESALKRNTTVVIDGEATQTTLSKANWAGAVWFYADPSKKSDKALPMENLTLEVLKKSSGWESFDEDMFLDAGEYYVALAFDKTKYENIDDMPAAGAVVTGRLKIDRMPISIKLTKAGGKNGQLLIAAGKSFIPSKDLSWTLYDEDDEELDGALAGFELTDEEGNTVGFAGEVAAKDLSAGHLYRITVQSFESDQCKLAKGYKKSNYVLSADSNTVQVNSFDPDKAKLTLKPGKYYEKLYFMTDTMLSKLKLSDYFNVFIEQEGIEPIELIDQNAFSWEVISANTPEKDREKAFESILNNKMSVAAQLKSIYTQSAADLYAGAKLLVAATGTELGLKAAFDNAVEITVKKQPVILINADPITGVRRFGLTKGTEYVNEKADYTGKLLVGLVDRDGNIVRDRKGGITDHSGSYQKLLGNNALDTLKVWSGETSAHIEIDSVLIERIDYEYGMHSVTLQIKSLTEGMDANFVLWGDQKYSGYDIADSRVIKFKKSNGETLKITRTTTVEKDGKTETVTDEVSEVIAGIKDGRITCKVDEFAGLVMPGNGVIYEEFVYSTSDAIYRLHDLSGGEESLIELNKGQIKPVNQKMVQVIDDNPEYDETQEGSTQTDSQDSTPVKTVDKVIYTGIELDCELTDNCGDIIEIIVSFPQDELGAADQGDPKFHVEYVSPVFYDSRKKVAVCDTRNLNTRVYAHDLDVRVYYGDELLEFNKDYTLSYANNVDAASADIGKKAPQIVVKGAGNYKDKKAEIHFTILPARLSEIADINIDQKFHPQTKSTRLKDAKIKLTFKEARSNVAAKMYDLSVYEYILDQNQRIVKKEPVDFEGISFAPAGTIRCFDVVAIANGKNKNLTENDLCFADLSVGDKIDSAEALSKVDLFVLPQKVSVKPADVRKLTSKAAYSPDGIGLDTFTNGNNKTAEAVANKAHYNLGGDEISDKVFIELLNENKTEVLLNSDSTDRIYKTGVHYIRVSPRPFDEDGNPLWKSMLLENGYFTTSKDIKVTVESKTGCKLVSSMVKLVSKYYDYSPDGPLILFSVKAEVDASKLAVYAVKADKSEIRIGNLRDYISDGLTIYDELKNINDANELIGYGTHTLVIKPDSELDDDGGYTGSIKLSYNIKALTLSKSDAIKIEFVKCDGYETDESQNRYPAYIYNAAGHDYDCVAVYVKNARNDEYVALESGKDYTLMWNDSKVGFNTGKVTIKAVSGKCISGSDRREYCVMAADISKAEPFIDGVTVPENSKIYYVAVPALKGEKSKPKSCFVQYAKTDGGADSQVFISQNVSSSNYKIVSYDNVNGTAVVDASNPSRYTGTYTMQYPVYTKKITKIKFTLANGGSVKWNDIEGRHAAMEAQGGQKGTGIVIEALEITYQDSTRHTVTITDKSQIRDMFDIYYSRNTQVGSGRVELSVKEGGEYYAEKTFMVSYKIYQD